VEGSSSGYTRISQALVPAKEMKKSTELPGEAANSKGNRLNLRMCASKGVVGLLDLVT
jgi:hypothetical protein